MPGTTIYRHSLSWRYGHSTGRTDDTGSCLRRVRITTDENASFEPFSQRPRRSQIGPARRRRYRTVIPSGEHQDAARQPSQVEGRSASMFFLCHLSSLSAVEGVTDLVPAMPSTMGQSGTCSVPAGRCDVCGTADAVAAARRWRA